MLPEYNQLLQKGVSQRKENKAFLLRLQKKPPSDLDNVVSRFHTEAFAGINCLKCANCCRTTGPLLKDKDIDALAGATRMRPAAFSEKYLHVDEDGDFVFKTMPCPFLGDDNCCAVYDDRPAACRTYPHTDQKGFRKITGITFRNSLVCPAVVEIIGRLKLHYRNI